MVYIVDHIVPTLIAIISVVIYMAYQSPETVESLFPSGKLISNSSLAFTGSASASSVIDGVSFPPQIKVAGTKQTLVGGGTRTKWTVKVYSMGIYSDEKLIDKLAKRHRGNNDDDDDAILADFSESERAKTLLLRFRRSVAASDVSEALEEALQPNIGNKASAAFSEFLLEVIGDARLEKGSDVYITCKDKKLTASTTGEAKESRTMAAVDGMCPAVFAVYLGDKPVSPQIKKGFVDGVTSLIEAE